jgi:hypothetical protein
MIIAALAASSPAWPASAQQAPTVDHPWSFDVGLGFENTLSGNINSGSIGTLDGQAVVILPNSYGDVYGTGFHFRFGGGYMIDEVTEARGIFTYQSIKADLTPMGDIGVSRLYGQYDPYRSLALDFGLRRYFETSSSVRPYLEGTIGLGFISDIDVELSAPAANMNRVSNDFFHSTTAVAFAGGAGLLWQVSPRTGVYGQLGLRWTSGLSTNNVGGLQGVNEGTSRWTIPVVVGARMRF